MRDAAPDAAGSLKTQRRSVGIMSRSSEIAPGPHSRTVISRLPRKT